MAQVQSPILPVLGGPCGTGTITPPAGVGWPMWYGKFHSKGCDPTLTYQIFVHHMLRGCFKAHHKCCLKGIAKISGFSGTIVPGKSLDTGDGTCVFTAINPHPVAMEASRHLEAGRDAPASNPEADDKRVELE
jgi:hypothetical protein